MPIIQQKLTRSFNNFVNSEKASGIVIILCTIISLVITNSNLGSEYLGLWHMKLGGVSVELWINDGLMAVFFLLIGLELKRELITGELSDIKNAMLPMFAALGGVVVPALIHYSVNRGTVAQSGVGIPMATDIAFALGVLALIGSRVPASLKVFLTALAVIDDLVAIIVIAVFYTSDLSTFNLFAAVGIFVLLLLLNHLFKVKNVIPYLIGGGIMWFLMLHSGIHATIAGVLLAFTVPFSSVGEDERSTSYKLEHWLHKPTAFLILPLFALANTGITISANWFSSLSEMNSIGIIVGLSVGKPLGIVLISAFFVAIGVCRLPLDLNWKHIFGAGLLGGIGFTMSIFITNLAFANNPQMINSSKMAILAASLLAGICGFVWLKLFGKPEDIDEDMDAMDFEED